ncbi:hypothetical protein [Catenibacterium sp.]|uniref:hypothetical protein n=1 Tax=Catenibacterium sp. TaxID=2049022 RepID=UPI003AAF84C2
MINAEKYRDEILAVTNKHEYFALKADNPTVITRCNNLEQCRGCLFDNGTCSSEKMKWLLSEYREPVKLTRFEQDILKYILEKTQYRFIVREKSGNIYIYKRKPKKGIGAWDSSTGMLNLNVFINLFPFIKWEDEEPTSIKDVLDNCEVVESDL